MTIQNRKKTPYPIWLIAGMIIVLAGCIYSNSFAVPFQFDDIPVIVKNSHIRDLADIKGLFIYDPTRFVTHVSFALNYALNGFRLLGYHLVNLILHILCALLAFCLVKKTTVLAGLDEDKDSDNTLFALLGALIFLSHPVQIQAVTYIVQRSTVLAALFYLWALLLYLRLRREMHGGLYGLFLVVILAGCMSKPIFVTLPFMIILYELYFFKPDWRAVKKKLKLYIPALLPLILVPLFLMLFTLNYLSEKFDWSKITYATRVTSEISRSTYLLTQFRVLVTYLRILFVPFRQNLDYDYALSLSFFDTQTFLSFGILVGILVMAILLFKKNKLCSFGIFWFFIALIPESSIFPLQDVIFEHRLYLAVVGFVFFLLGALRLWTKKRAALIILNGLVIIYAILSYARNIFWQNPTLMLQDVVAQSPNKARPHNNLGVQYKKMGLNALAKKEFEHALTLDDQYVQSYVNLGQLYQDERKPQDAIVYYRAALRLDPNLYEAHLNIGNLFYYEGRLGEAVDHYEAASRIRPGAAKPYLNIGNVFMRINNFGNAKKYYEQAIEHNPRFALAHYAMGNLYMAQQNFQRAIEYFHKAIREDPAYVDAYNVLGVAYLRAGEDQEGERYLKKTIELDPRYFLAYLNLANYYGQKGNKALAQQYKTKALMFKGASKIQGQ